MNSLYNIIKLAEFFHKKAVKLISLDEDLYNYDRSTLLNYLESYVTKFSTEDNKIISNYIAYNLICPTFDFIFKKYNFPPAKNLIEKEFINNNEKTNFANYIALQMHDLTHYAINKDSYIDIEKVLKEESPWLPNLEFEEGIVTNLEFPNDNNAYGLEKIFLKAVDEVFNYDYSKKITNYNEFAKKFHYYVTNEQYGNINNSKYKKYYNKILKQICENIKKEYEHGNLKHLDRLNSSDIIINLVSKLDYSNHNFISNDIQSSIRMFIKLVEKKIMALDISSIIKNATFSAKLNKLAIQTINNDTSLFNYNLYIFENPVFKYPTSKNYINNLIKSTFDSIFLPKKLPSAEQIIQGITTSIGDQEDTSSFLDTIHDLIHYVVNKESHEHINAYNTHKNKNLNYQMMNPDLYLEEDIAAEIEAPGSEDNEYRNGMHSFFKNVLNISNSLEEFETYSYSGIKGTRYERYYKPVVRKIIDKLEQINEKYNIDENFKIPEKKDIIESEISRIISNTDLSHHNIVPPEILRPLQLWLKLLIKKLKSPETIAHLKKLHKEAENLERIILF